MGFCTVEHAVETFKKGGIVIVCDDENRENEGDFIMSAEKATPGAINIMAKYGRGLICVPITLKRSQELQLASPVYKDKDHFFTAFTESVDVINGTTTGISAFDRTSTIRHLANENAHAIDFRRPGHIFPIIGTQGGVIRRAGHTEAAIDLAQLANLYPAGVICEIMADDGTMANTKQLIKMSNHLKFPITTIEKLIKYRLTRETLVSNCYQQTIDTKFGVFNMIVFDSTLCSHKNIAFVKGKWTSEEIIPVRVHAASYPYDILDMLSPSSIIERAFRVLEKYPKGVFLYILSSSYSNTKKDDNRDYGIGAQILKSLGIRKIKLITNNMVRRVGLKSFNLKIVETIPL